MPKRLLINLAALLAATTASAQSPPDLSETHAFVAACPAGAAAIAKGAIATAATLNKPFDGARLMYDMDIYTGFAPRLPDVTPVAPEDPKNNIPGYWVVMQYRVSGLPPENRTSGTMQIFGPGQTATEPTPACRQLTSTMYIDSTWWPPGLKKQIDWNRTQGVPDL